MDEDMINMGKRIQMVRKQKGYKGMEFADMIGIGKDQLSRIENGKLPCKLEHLFVIARVLNVSSDYLLYGTEENNIVMMLKDMNSSDIQKIKKIIEILIN